MPERARRSWDGHILVSNSTGRRNFLSVLARDFDVDRANVDRAVDVFHHAGDPASRGDAERALRSALEPGRMRLLTQFNGLPEGVKFLVDMRAQLLEWSRHDPLMSALEADLKSLLKNWFDVGFLELRRITWDSPASLLEKLIAYEAVHAIRGWKDLKNRLDSDRRCFAFFHPRMPNEPLIFVEVALVTGMSGNVQTLLDEAAPVQDPQTADTAIFYSISNAQKGLGRHQLRQFPDQAGGRQLACRVPQSQILRDVVADPGLPPLAGRRIGGGGWGRAGHPDGFGERAASPSLSRPRIAIPAMGPGERFDGAARPARLARDEAVLKV